MFSNEIKTNVITCFTQLSLSLYYLTVSSFDITNMDKISSLSDFKIEVYSFVSIKSVVNKEKTKAFICYVSGEQDTYCLIYYININSFSNKSKFFEKC